MEKKINSKLRLLNLRLVAGIFGFFLLALSIAISLYCVRLHIWPEHGRFGDAQMRLFFVTAFFVIFAPALGAAGQALVCVASKSRIWRAFGMALLLPAVGTLIVVIFKLGQGVIEVL